MDENRVTKAPLPREVDAEEMARDLSAAQRDYLAEDPVGREGNRSRTRKVLEDRGLVARRGPFVRPTALGRRVLAADEE